MSFSIQIPLSAFNASVQQTVREVLAVAAGLARTDFARVLLVVRAERRLLSSGISIDATIVMPDTASASRAASSLTSNNLNTNLVMAGLPPATVTSAATVTSGATRGLRASSICGLLFLAMTVLTAQASSFKLQ